MKHLSVVIEIHRKYLTENKKSTKQILMVNPADSMIYRKFAKNLL